MKKHIVLIIGQAAAGKDTAAQYFSDSFARIDFSQDIIMPRFVHWYNKGEFDEKLAKLEDVPFLRWHKIGPQDLPQYDPTDRSLKERLRAHKEHFARLERDRYGDSVYATMILAFAAADMSHSHFVVTGARLRGDFEPFFATESHYTVTVVEVVADADIRRKRLKIPEGTPLPEEIPGSTDFDLLQYADELRRDRAHAFHTIDSNGSPETLKEPIAALEKSLLQQV